LRGLETLVNDLTSLGQTLAEQCHKVINSVASLGATVLPFHWQQYPVLNPEHAMVLPAMSTLCVSALRSMSVGMVMTIIPSPRMLTQTSVKQGKV